MNEWRRKTKIYEMGRTREKNKNFQCDICQAHIKKVLKNSGNGKMKSEVCRRGFCVGSGVHQQLTQN